MRLKSLKKQLLQHQVVPVSYCVNVILKQTLRHFVFVSKQRKQWSSMTCFINNKDFLLQVWQYSSMRRTAYDLWWVPLPFRKCLLTTFSQVVHGQKIDNEVHTDNQTKKFDEEELVFYQGVQGKPGVDFPVLSHIPRTSFNCRDVDSGYYADLETDCQVSELKPRQYVATVRFRRFSTSVKKTRKSHSFVPTGQFSNNLN